jgi:hypothetical protein
MREGSNNSISGGRRESFLSEGQDLVLYIIKVKISERLEAVTLERGCRIFVFRLKSELHYF